MKQYKVDNIANFVYYGKTQLFDFVDPLNLALRKPTYQSSTEYWGRANHAVDGNREGDFRRKSCSLTSTGDSPWWTVDLQRVYEIVRVAITNRADKFG